MKPIFVFFCKNQCFKHPGRLLVFLATAVLVVSGRPALAAPGQVFASGGIIQSLDYGPTYIQVGNSVDSREVLSATDDTSPSGYRLDLRLLFNLFSRYTHFGLATGYNDYGSVTVSGTEKLLESRRSGLYVAPVFQVNFGRGSIVPFLSVDAGLNLSEDSLVDRNVPAPLISGSFGTIVNSFIGGLDLIFGGDVGLTAEDMDAFFLGFRFGIGHKF